MKSTLSKALFAVCAVALIAAVALSLNSIFGWMGFTYANAEKYTAGDAEILDAVKKLDIDWTSGVVTVVYHQDSKILLSEKANKALNNDNRMRWWLDGDTLRVRYEKPGMNLSFGNWGLEKELTVTLPEGIVLDDAAISATSGNLVLPLLRADQTTLNVTSGSIDATVSADKIICGSTSGNLNLRLENEAEEIVIGSTSGKIQLEAAGAEKVHIGSASGSIRAAMKTAGALEAVSTSGDIQAIIGEARSADIGCTSGAVQIKIGKFDKMNVHTTSGSVTAALPAEPGFTAHFDTASGKIEHSLPLAGQNGVYVCGNGSASLKIETTSGNILVSALSE